MASVTTVSRSQENINAAYESMKRHTKREHLPFNILLGDITDPDFRLKHFNENSKLVCVFTSLPTIR